MAWNPRERRTHFVLYRAPAETACLIPELSFSSEQTRLECPQGNAQQVARFPARHFVIIGHRKRLLKGGCHFPELSFEETEALFSRRNHFRVRLWVGEPFHPGGVVCRVRFHVGIAPVRFPFSLDHQGCVHHDASEPGRKSRTTLKTSQVMKCRQG